MERKIINSVRQYVDYLEYVESGQMARRDDIQDYSGICLKVKRRPNGKAYYYKKDKGEKKYKYFGRENEEVGFIKEAHYYDESIPAIQTNLEVCHNLLDKFRLTDYDSINEIMPKTYRNPPLRIAMGRITPSAQKWKEEREAYKARCGPWFPEDLKVTTADDSLVRSKSEGLIYNQYLSFEATFVYELAIKLRSGQIRHPDFTILSEVDWTSIILHDHEGMYGTEKERRRYNEDMYLYWQNGFIPGLNIFYTFDDPRGGFDISVVRDIMNTKIRPEGVI